MKKLIVCISLAVTGLMTSCVDKYEEVPADSKPEWLGGSIFEELSNPNQSYLTGTFNTYLRLVDDLGYTSTLSRTGSKTIFPANDDAFNRFFQSNDWGVSSYEQLSEAQKKMLLYTSMLDNALLVNMLANVSNGSSSVASGMAVKHATNVNVIDSVTFVNNAAKMPQNNKYWTRYYGKGLNYVSDDTRPMMVHFTREQMVNNSITTAGDLSDFEILTGSPYTEGSAYIFRDKIINSDVTCMNGYIHQMEDVLVPPGNMAEVIRKDDETSIFSRMLDYYSAPYYDATVTNNYNDWAIANGRTTIDSIYQMRYLSALSQNQTALITIPAEQGGNVVSSYLSYDPGWNQYYPTSGNSTSYDRSLTDIGAMFVPDDNAIKSYFLPGGSGAYLIDIYGDKDNNEANLLENLDSLYSKRPGLVTSFINNLMMSSFVETVPSKFTSITNDASENMGMNTGYLKQESDGKYDVKIANNGVVYVLKDVIAPDEFQAVLAPSSAYPDMQVMNWAVQDNGESSYLGVDFKFYLLAMSANYAFFIPDDEAFDMYYIDPTSLGRGNGTQAYALHFYYDATYNRNNHLRCERYYWNNVTKELGERIGEVTTISEVKTQLVDILNYHTVVLDEGKTIADNHYFKTKHGGEIYVSGPNVGDYVASGAQIDNGLEVAKIETIYNEKNGNAYRLNHVIQPTQNSVYKTLKDNSQFSEFLDACAGFDATDLLSWAGISDETNSFGTSEQSQYTIFTSTYGTGTNAVQDACLDYNVKFFNTYNYTLFAPNNEAMEKAYAAGLPRWSEIQAMFEEYGEEASDAVKAEAKDMIKQIRNFVRYHFMSTSIYADNEVESGDFQSLCSDDMGLAIELEVSSASGNGKIIVQDAAGVSHTIDANGSLLVNKMARDYWFNAARTSASSITTSSFCAVHEISEPLYNDSSKRFDN